MADLPVSALGPKQQKEVENARIAVDLGNFDYAIEICTDVLKIQPGSVSTRRLQRIASVRRAEFRNTYITKLRGWVIIVLGFSAVRGSPERLIEVASTVLIEDPRNVLALRWLAAAASRLNFGDTVVFALEALQEIRPADFENMLALGAALLDTGRPDEALRIADAVLKARPVDGAAQDLMRRASVRQTERDGNWTAPGAVRVTSTVERPIARSTPTAEVVTSGDWTQRLIDDALARLANEQDNLAHYVSLVNGYRRLGRWDQALDWIRQARARKVVGAEIALEEHEAELRALLLEQRFRDAESMLARSREDPELQARCTTARGEWLAFQISEVRRLLVRNPDDRNTRQRLASLYFENGDTDLAIAEFQQNETDARFRVAALMGLGRAFKRKRMFDQAIDRLALAKQELDAMDDVKKEVIYELGGCLLLKGEIDAAMAEFKSIHNDDAALSGAKLAGAGPTG